MIKKILLAASMVAGITGVAKAEEGVHSDKIVFGQTAAFEGPTAALGNGMNDGIMAAFKEANDAGGVHGRKLELIKYNDGYEPEQAIENTNKLIEEDNVFALIGAVGTPTSKVIQPITTSKNVPLIGPFTGAGFLRYPENSNVLNVRGTYDQETEAWIKHLTEDLNISKIAILYQDDGFGRVGLAGVKKAMEKRGLSLVAEGTYTRNTTAVKSALIAIKKASPEAVVMVGAYKPIAEFVKLSKKVGMDPVFVTISFVGSKALAGELGGEGAGVVISQVVPFPEDTSIKLVSDYQKALKAYNGSLEPGFVSLEGYMVGKLAVKALQEAGSDVTRQGLLDAVYSKGKFDMGGVTLNYGENDNQGMEEVYMTVIQPDGSFKSVDKLSR